MSDYVMDYKGFTLLARPKRLVDGRFKPQLVASRDSGDHYEEHHIPLAGRSCMTADEAASFALRRGFAWVEAVEAPAFA